MKIKNKYIPNEKIYFPNLLLLSAKLSRLRTKIIIRNIKLPIIIVVVQFIDNKPNAFHRPYTNSLKRCEEVINKLKLLLMRVHR
jgi:hypothetical protein